MIHIAYKLDMSDLHGVGLFADQDIPAGTVIYTASPLLDLNINNDTYEALSDLEKKEVRWWGFWDETNNVWHVDFDVSKFINHSPDATTTQDPQFKDAHLIAARDIKKGEELTQNYLEFESEEDLKHRGI